MAGPFLDSQKVKDKVAGFFESYPSATYKAGEIILRPGTAPSGIFYIKSGFVEAFLDTNRGESLVLHIFKPGSFFYMYWLLVSRGQNDYYFQAKTRAVLFKAPFSQVLEFISANPDVLLGFTSRLLVGVDGVLRRFETVVISSAKGRVAALLSYFLRNFGESGTKGRQLSVPLTHREIASWIGATRETVSLEMGQLARKGIIARKGRKIVIDDERLLEKIAALGSLLYFATDLALAVMPDGFLG